jgi:hypothetical protein
MNNVGNALLNSANNTVNNAVNNALNTVQNGVGGYGAVFLTIGILLLLLLAYMLYAGQTTIVNILPGLNAPLPQDWREIQKQERATATTGAGAGAAAATNPVGFGENWCFVGEDVTGRWCVKVPQPDACSSERLFSSRPGCELVAASPLPLGLIAKGGAEMNPSLAAAHTK